jgi:hypothetical protein
MIRSIFEWGRQTVIKTLALFSQYGGSGSVRYRIPDPDPQEFKVFLMGQENCYEAL